MSSPDIPARACVPALSAMLGDKAIQALRLADARNHTESSSRLFIQIARAWFVHH